VKARHFHITLLLTVVVALAGIPFAEEWWARLAIAAVGVAASLMLGELAAHRKLRDILKMSPDGRIFAKCPECDKNWSVP
jgi:hypothetical protein